MSNTSWVYATIMVLALSAIALLLPFFMHAWGV